MEPIPSDHESTVVGYEAVLNEVVEFLEAARRASARAVNAVMTATYWEIGRRIVECEQGSEHRAAYGKSLIERLSVDLMKRYGRGFGVVNLHQMRRFYLEWPAARILQTPSEESGQPPVQQPAVQTTPAPPSSEARASRFPLPWSHYVKLMAVSNRDARAFYEAEAL